MMPDYPKPPFASQKRPMPGVMLADPMSSYVSGTTVAVTGGKPFI